MCTQKDKYGLRCGMHVKQEIKQSEELLASAQNKLNEMIALRNDPSIYRGTPEFDEVDKKYADAVKLHTLRTRQLHNKQQEYYTTDQGLAEFKELAMRDDTDETMEQYDEHKRSRDRKAINQDRLHKTVNGKKPAKNYDEQTIKKLQENVDTQQIVVDALNTEAEGTTDAATKADLWLAISRAENKAKHYADELNHAKATASYVKKGIIPDPVKIKEHEEQAAAAAKRRQESIDRSDTDGFMSQWASGITSQKERLEAELEENNGFSTFLVLFDLEGNIVPARMIDTKYGPAWAEYEDPHNMYSKFTGKFINESKSAKKKTQEAYLRKKGYTLGKIKAPAKVDTVGANMVSVQAVVLRKGKDPLEAVEIITTNIYEGDTED